MSQHIRIGFIGAGEIAKSRHLPNLKELPEVELIAVANRRKASAEQVAKQYGFRKVYEQWQKVIDDPEVDAVFICTPPYMHAEITCYALAAGKHVFCQARMAMNVMDAHRMLVADRGTQLTTMLCPPPHYMKVEAWVRSYMKQGKLGDIRHIVVNHAGSMFLDPQQPLHWRQRGDLQGINLLDVGITAEILIKWFGSVSEIRAVLQNWIDERPADEEGRTKVELPDSATIIGKFNSGATLTALFSGAIAGGQSSMVIHGSKGTLTCFPNTVELIIDDEQGRRTLELPQQEQGEWTVERDFIQAVREGRKGDPSFELGAEYMAFTQAVMDNR